MLAEKDLEIVNALQVNPRASWVEVGRALGVDPTTAARRWDRLTDRGAAWVACQPLIEAQLGLAIIEISAQPGHSLEVAAELARDPQAMTVDITAGARDLIVTVVCSDAEQLAWYLLKRLATLEHVVRVQSHVLVKAYSEASRWRLRSLTPAQQRALRPLRTREPGASALVTDERDRALMKALSVDGRTSLRNLAQVVGTSESTVRRRLGQLLEAGMLRLRCELARELTGWTVSSWFLTRVSPDRLDEAATALTTIPEVRAVLSAAGPYNMLVAVWLRTIADGQHLESQIMRKLPFVDVADRSVVIRPYKLAGRLLDPRGFATGVVPLDLSLGARI